MTDQTLESAAKSPRQPNLRTLAAILAVGALLVAGAAAAALPKAPLQPKPAKILAQQGSVIGGVTGSGYTLKDLRLVKMGGKERLIVDFADMQGRAVKGLPGYYHVEMKDKPKRLVVDFAQTAGVFFDEKKLRERLKPSGLVTSSRLLVDPYDQSISIVLELKDKTRAQVFQVPGRKETGRVVVDLL